MGRRTTSNGRDLVNGRNYGRHRSASTREGSLTVRVSGDRSASPRHQEDSNEDGLTRRVSTRHLNCKWLALTRVARARNRRRVLSHGRRRTRCCPRGRPKERVCPTRGFRVGLPGRRSGSSRRSSKDHRPWVPFFRVALGVGLCLVVCDGVAVG